MKNYQKRGMNMLVVFLVACVVGIILCFFESTRTLGIGYLIGSALFNLSRFLYYRSLTPAQFEAEQKKERTANDERNQQIGARTCQIAVMVMFVSLAVGAVIYEIAGDESAVYANLGQVVVLMGSILITGSILKKKM